MLVRVFACWRFSPLPSRNWDIFSPTFAILSTAPENESISNRYSPRIARWVLFLLSLRDREVLDRLSRRSLKESQLTSCGIWIFYMLEWLSRATRPTTLAARV